MIKSYYFFTRLDKFTLLTYLNRNETVVESIDELDAMYRLPIYLDGKGALFFFDNGRIVASGNVVLKEVELLKTAYIHRLDCLERQMDKLKQLVLQAKMVATYLGATDVFVGASEALLGELDLTPDYRSLNMTLSQPKVGNNVFELEPVNEANKNTYVAVYADSFYDTPHAATFSEDNLTEKQCYLVIHEQSPIGFINFEIDGVDGFFDMGLTKAHQNKKLGINLLQTAVNYLVKQQVSVNLTVIEKNEKAFKLYQKNGFVIKDVLTHWTQL